MDKMVKTKDIKAGTLNHSNCFMKKQISVSQSDHKTGPEYQDVLKVSKDQNICLLGCTAG